jgi:hypothetical protein
MRPCACNPRVKYVLYCIDTLHVLAELREPHWSHFMPLPHSAPHLVQWHRHAIDLSRSVFGFTPATDPCSPLDGRPHPRSSRICLILPALPGSIFSSLSLSFPTSLAVAARLVEKLGNQYQLSPRSSHPTPSLQRP